MKKNRLEAFSDGVIAILITIMVLELKPPDGSSIASIHHLGTNLAGYLLSFVLVGIYWNNHHHLFSAVDRVDGAVLWANMALLFSLSLVPVVTAWFGEHPGTSGPAFWYSIVQLICGLSYFVLTKALLRTHGSDSTLATAIGADWKAKLSLVTYTASACVAPFAPWVSMGLIAAVAIAWFIPDRRISRVIGAGDDVASEADGTR